MKKLSLVATAVLGLISTTAMAQSNVTIYGILDGGVSYVSGLRNGNSTAIVSGIMDGSRFGLRGTEDIGGGYKAIFTLENRLELDTGSVTNRPASGTQLPDRLSTASGLGLSTLPLPAATTAALIGAVNGGITSGLGVNIAGNLFDRQAFAGLVTPVGAFTLGRQYTPAYLVGATFDASQTQSSLAAGQVGGISPAFDIRLSNTVQYGIQLNGVTAAAMYGAGEVAGDSGKGRFFGGMAMYKAAGYSLGLGYNTRNNELAQKSLTNVIAGATVDIGPGTLYGQYATVKDENPTGVSTVGATIAAASGSAAVGAAFQNAYIQALRQDARLMHIGYKLTSGVHTFVVAYSRYDDKRPNNADTNSYGVTYTYALSKRTSLNGVLTRFSNSALAQTAPGQAGFLGGVTSTAGTGSTNVALGINHKF
jgi:predicted porin